MSSIVILYSELAQYFISCVERLATDYNGSVYVVHWPVNPEAPFQFRFPDNVSFVPKKEVSDLLQYVKDKHPEIVVSVGWMDKDYVSVCGALKSKCHTVVSLDNHWNGGVKQRLATIVSPFILRNKFSHAWVPGPPQEKFARKLGFKSILKSYYSADVALFDEIYAKSIEQKKTQFPRRILYVGRYMKHKGIYEMWQAFLDVRKRLNSDWELWCVGTGSDFDNRVEEEGIKHFGFIQPSELDQIVAEAGVFILPSKFEPWGVVVHEYALAGFPLLLSTTVGAADAFLVEGKNGYSFHPENEQELQSAFEKIMTKNQEELMLMSDESRKLAFSITPQTWSDNLLSILK